MTERPFRYPTPARLAALALGLALTGAACPGLAADSRIELRDGSVLRGELVSVGNGVYRIRSPSLGEIEVPEADVAAIRPLAQGAAVTDGAPLGAPGTESAAGAAPGTAGELAAIQQRLMGDPSVMQAILGLQDDPELKAALADPAFARLVLSGDIAALQTDPRFQRLLAHPGLQGILRAVGGQ